MTFENYITRRKPVYGIGINDADYVTQPMINGKRIGCLYFRIWKSMITRCYSAKCHEKQPAYIDCSVVPEWLSFMNFRRWMEKQDWQGKQLDKDILIPGNKIYGPETCLFVTRRANNLLIDNPSLRGEHPKGVYFCKKTGKYKAQLNIGRKRKGLGYFDSSDSANLAYKQAKRLCILRIACCEPNIKAKQGLYRHAELLR